MFSLNNWLPGMARVRLIGGLVILLGIPFTFIQGQQKAPEVIRIGVTRTGPESKDKKKEEAALKSLQTFIQEETGFRNEIFQMKDWHELSDKMEKKELHLAAFQGCEFAWASEKMPDLKPLVVAINIYAYPVAYAVVNKTNPAKDFGGLKNQSFATPNTGQMHLKVFLEKECRERGQAPDHFFSKISFPDNVEEALDDVVDGVLQGIVADRTALEAFKRRKPARFAHLKEIAHSQPFPPWLIAYTDGVLDDTILARCRVGLLEAHNKEKGQTMLTLFKLTRFEKVPADFANVVTQTRKSYLPSRLDAK